MPRPVTSATARIVETGVLFKRVVLVLLLGWGVPAAAQGMNDLLAGKLVDPKVGQWAWYDLTDTSGANKFMVRQAIVGEEKVGRQTAHWVEVEIVPAIGYKTAYKMLLTGPASDPRNIHKIVYRQEPDPPEELPVDEALGDMKAVPEPKRERVGKDTVKTASGDVDAEHYRVAGANGPLDIWINESLPPTGIVRITSEEGEMILKAYGVGGSSAASAMDAQSDAKKPQVTVKTEKRGARPKDAQPKEDRKAKP
jgi:hypothetical protein